MQKHGEETEMQVDRLSGSSTCFANKPCEAIEGLIAEAQAVVEEFKTTTQELVSAAQAIENHEISR